MNNSSNIKKLSDIEDDNEIREVFQEYLKARREVEENILLGYTTIAKMAQEIPGVSEQQAVEYAQKKIKQIHKDEMEALDARYSNCTLVNLMKPI